MKIFLLFIGLFITSAQFINAQIEVKINKVSKDSFNIEFPENMGLEMGKKYTFIFKANFSKEDGYRENFTDELIYDGLVVEKAFNYHEYGFAVYSLPKKDHSVQHDSKIIYIKGTRYIVKIDGKIISRYDPNTITSKSIIEIQVFSDTENLTKMSIEDLIVFQWIGNSTSFTELIKVNETLVIDLSKHKKFTRTKGDAIILALPQIFIGKNKLLPDNQQERMYIMGYTK